MAAGCPRTTRSCRKHRRLSQDGRRAGGTRESQPASRGRTDQETRRSTRTLEDITARQKDLRVIPQRRAAEEEKKMLERGKM